MFGSNRKTENDEIVQLGLHTTSNPSKRTVITRNRNSRRRRRAGMNLYHRADQFLMRFRVSESNSY